jgi:hypothetical protein
MGWGALQNGALLREAVAAGFGALLTMDQRIGSQQNLSRIGIGIVVLHATDSRLVTLRPLLEDILRALDTVDSGTVVGVGTP